MRDQGVAIVGALVLVLCAVWVVVLVATAFARYRGFRVSLDRPGVHRIDAAWFVAMGLLLAGLVILARTYAVGP
jgi:type II secretory pathway component PulK